MKLQLFGKKSKSSIKPEEYNEFYKTVSMDYNEPLAHIHTNLEWMVSYKALLYIPKEKICLQICQTQTENIDQNYMCKMC